MMHFIEENRINSVFIKRNNIGLLYKIMSELRGLQDDLKKGPSVEAMLEIPTSYRFLHVEQRYVFYRLENSTAFVADIFNEH